MPSDFGSTIIPPLLFFMVFFGTFLLFELLIVYVLNFLQKKYWVFVVDIMIKARVHHGKAIKLVSILAAVIFLGIILIFTPFFEVLSASSKTVRVLGILLIVEMVLVYFVTYPKVTNTSIEKALFKYSYFVISTLLYVSLIIAANAGYTRYQAFINERVVETTVEGVQFGIENRAIESALSEARRMHRSALCPFEDYSKKTGQGLVHFVYLSTDEEFKNPDAQIRANDDTFDINGWECPGEKTLLVTDGGKWYEIIRKN